MRRISAMTALTALTAATALTVATGLVGMGAAYAADTSSAPFAGTVSEIVDPAAETGILRRWMRHVGDPAPAGYSHGYQWGTPSITTPADATVTFSGTLDLTTAGVDDDGGDFGLIGLFDTATLAGGERGLNEGSYMYIFLTDENTVVLGLSDGRGAGGEYVQTFHTIDLTADRVLDVVFTIDPAADPALCASDAADAATAEGCMTLVVDDLPVLQDSYGTITNALFNGGVEFGDGGTVGWDGLASAQDATGIVFDLTVSPVIAPTTKDDCKTGGWQTLPGDFANQGDCVSSFATPSS